jgi:hypothetical protein
VPPPDVPQSETPPAVMPSSSHQFQAPRSPAKTLATRLMNGGSTLARQVQERLIRKSIPAAAVVEAPSETPNAVSVFFKTCI